MIKFVESFGRILSLESTAYQYKEIIIVKIEDYWLDGELYSVCFETIDHRRIHKMIVLPPASDGIINVEEIIRNRFNSVYDILNVDELESCLVLKGA